LDPIHQVLFCSIDDAKRALLKLALRLAVAKTGGSSGGSDGKGWQKLKARKSQCSGAIIIFDQYDCDGSADLSLAEFDKLLLESGIVVAKAVSRQMFEQALDAQSTLGGLGEWALSVASV
jgi:hypothetical protein